MKTTFIHFITFGLLCIAPAIKAQNVNISASAPPQPESPKYQSADLYSRDAHFPGIQKYLLDSLQYPELARKYGKEGYVSVKATIRPDGSVSAIKVIEGLGLGCDEVVVSLLSKMPKWTPAMQSGRPVSQKVFIRVYFRLQ